MRTRCMSTHSLYSICNLIGSQCRLPSTGSSDVIPLSRFQRQVWQLRSGLVEVDQLSPEGVLREQSYSSPAWLSRKLTPGLASVTSLPRMRRTDLRCRRWKKQLRTTTHPFLQGAFHLTQPHPHARKGQAWPQFNRHALANNGRVSRHTQDYLSGPAVLVEPPPIALPQVPHQHNSGPGTHERQTDIQAYSLYACKHRLYDTVFIIYN